jgi:diacylglycerol kinase family enzyme
LFLPGIGVIHNPHSRKNKKDPEWMNSMGYLVGSRGSSVSTQHIEDVTSLVQKFRDQSIDILAINGGDGSNSIALTALVEVYGQKPLPKIALLRGGTMNIGANSCNIKGTPGGLLLNLVHKYREGHRFETTWRDTLKIEDRVGFVFGLGFIHTFLEALYESGQKSVWGTTKLIGQAVGSALVNGPLAARLFDRIEADVLVDGKTIPQRSFTAIAAATVSQIGMNFSPFFKWDERPHSFHLIGVICSPIKVVNAMPKAYLGKKVSGKKFIDLSASHVFIRSDQELNYTLDGENFSTGKTLALSTGPRLEIIVR